VIDDDAGIANASRPARPNPEPVQDRRLRAKRVAEQPDLDIRTPGDNRSVCREAQPSAGLETSLKQHHPIDVRAIDQLLQEGQNCPENFHLAERSARACSLPDQPKEKPTSCHSASRPRHPGITGRPCMAGEKNQRSGFTSRLGAGEPLAGVTPSFEISCRATSASAAAAAAGRR